LLNWLYLVNSVFVLVFCVRLVFRLVVILILLLILILVLIVVVLILVIVVLHNGKLLLNMICRNYINSMATNRENIQGVFK